MCHEVLKEAEVMHLVAQGVSGAVLNETQLGPR
jgi:hypothetical protein